MQAQEVMALVQGQLTQSMQQLMQDVTNHVTNLLQSQQSQTAPAVSAGSTAQRPAEPDSEEESGEDPWDGVLPVSRRTPVGAGAVLAQRLSCPPRLDGIKEHMKSQQLVQGIPMTVPPRRHRTDRALFAAQTKLEGAMSLMVDVAERYDVSQGPLMQAAALTRSAFEDLTDLRRKTLAGFQASRLDPREDASQLRLLSPEEERRIKPPRRFHPSGGKGGGKGHVSHYEQPSRPSFPSAWKPKGRGKGGKGKAHGGTPMQE
jgi:hypothetical protein